MTLDLFRGWRVLLAGSARGGLWLAAGLIAVILLWWLYRTERHLVSRRAGICLLALRLLAAVVLVVALFEPIAARVFDESLRGRVIVGIDISRSMETVDPSRPSEARQQLASVLGIRPGESLDDLTRREVVRRLIDGDNTPIARLTVDHSLAVFAFANRIAPASLKSLVEFLKDPPKAEDTARLVTDWQPLLAEGLRSGETGAPLIGVVLMTDGRQNAPGDQMQTIDRLAARGVPVFPILVGSTIAPRDAAIVTVKAPETVYRGDVARIEATLKIDGYPGQSITVTLDRPNASPMSQVLRVPAETSEFRPVVTFQVPLEEVGPAALSLAIGHPIGDTRPDNDRRNLMIQVADDKADVLIVDGEARWEFRYIRNALARDPHVRATAVVFHQPEFGTQRAYESSLPNVRREPTDKQSDPLGAFDAVILGDLDPADMPQDIWTRLESYVADRGGTLVFNPGPNSWSTLLNHETVRKLLPVLEPRPIPVAPTFIDPAHPAMVPGVALQLEQSSIETNAWPMLQLTTDSAQNRSIWAGLPRLPWVLSGHLKPGATSLATTIGNDSNPVMAAQPYGLGKVLWIGTDGTWRWRYRVGDTYHHRFWGQVIRWATSSKLATGNTFVRFGPIRPRIEEGEDIRIQARIADGISGVSPDLMIAARLYKIDPASTTAYAKVGKDHRPEAHTPTTGEAIAVVPLAPVAGQPRMFEGGTSSLPVGSYAIRLDVPQLAQALHLDEATGAMPESRIDIVGRQTSEIVELAANRDPLDRLASATGGRVLIDYEASQLGPLLRARAKTVSRTEETPLWDQPIALMVFFGILTLEWVARKRLGLP